MGLHAIPAWRLARSAGHELAAHQRRITQLGLAALRMWFLSSRWSGVWPAYLASVGAALAIPLLTLVASPSGLVGLVFTLLILPNGQALLRDVVVLLTLRLQNAPSSFPHTPRTT
jgi:polyferredoxin